MSREGGDTGGGAAAPAEGSPAKKSRVGKASFRTQAMPRHNKATSSLSLPAKRGLPGAPKTGRAGPGSPKVQAEGRGPLQGGELRSLLFRGLPKARVPSANALMGGKVCSGVRAGGALATCGDVPSS